MWYYAKNGSQLGPISQEELLQKFRGGELEASDLVWKQGMSDWTPVGRISELANPSVLAAPDLPSSGGSWSQNPTGGAMMPAPKINNYLWQSIVVTMLCCMPFGVVAIVHSAKVDGLVARGAYDEAQAAAKTARLWVFLSIGGFVLFFAAYLMLAITGVIASGI